MKKLFVMIVMSLMLGCTLAALADPTPAPTPWPGPNGPDKRGPIDPIPPPIPPPDVAH